MQQTRLGGQTASKALVWQWYWPELKDFAASIQHDWDGGKAGCNRVPRMGRSALFALYVLVPDDIRPKPNCGTKAAGKSAYM